MKPTKSSNRKAASRHLDELKELVGFCAETSSHSKTAKEIPAKVKSIKTLNIPTKGPVEVVVFKDPLRRKLNEDGSSRSTKKENSQEEKEFDMQQARFDIRKFAMTGLVGASREEEKINLLLQLGAKPPKREFVNYKLLMAKKKQDKLDQEQEELNWSNRMMTYKKAGTTKKKRDRNKVRNFDSQVGKFKDGVQYLNPKQLRSMQPKKDRSKGRRKNKASAKK